MGEQQRFGSDGLGIARDLCAAWDSYQADRDRARLQQQTTPLQHKLRALLEHAARKSPRTKYHRQFARACSSAGPRSRPSPTPTASSRPTTTPNAGCAAPSSTASSHSAAKQTRANARSSGCSPPRSPAACNHAPRSPTSPTSSPPASAATPPPRSPDRGGPERLPQHADLQELLRERREPSPRTQPHRDP